MKWFPPEAGEDEEPPHLISGRVAVQEIKIHNRPGGGGGGSGLRRPPVFVQLEGCGRLIQSAICFQPPREASRPLLPPPPPADRAENHAAQVSTRAGFPLPLASPRPPDTTTNAGGGGGQQRGRIRLLPTSASVWDCAELFDSPLNPNRDVDGHERALAWEWAEAESAHLPSAAAGGQRRRLSAGLRSRNKEITVTSV